MRAIQGDSGIRTAATIQHVLTQAASGQGPQRGAGGGRSSSGDRASDDAGADRSGGPPTGGSAAQGGAGPASGTARRGASAQHGSEDAPRQTRSYTSSVAFDSSRKHPSRRTMGAILAGLAIAVVIVIGLVLAWGFGALGG